MGEGVRVEQESKVRVETDADIVLARQQGRAIARDLGFTLGNATLIATAISELARNIVQYATRQKVILKGIENRNHKGRVALARTNGPVINALRRCRTRGAS